MKKFSLVLALVILFTCFSGAYAATLDLDYVREMSNLFTIDVEIEDDVAFVESALNAEQRSFVHKYDSKNLYSTTKFDMLVIDYSKLSAYPVFRLWISYCTDDDYRNISSVSFVIDGKKYTFSEVSKSEWYTHTEDGYVQEMMIKFDGDNVDFLIALENLVPENLDGLENIEIPFILNGREKIETTLDGMFLLDFVFMKRALVESNGLDSLWDREGTPMTVKDVASAF